MRALRRRPLASVAAVLLTSYRCWSQTIVDVSHFVGRIAADEPLVLELAETAAAGALAARDRSRHAHASRGKLTLLVSSSVLSVGRRAPTLDDLIVMQAQGLHSPVAASGEAIAAAVAAQSPKNAQRADADDRGGGGAAGSGAGAGAGTGAAATTTDVGAAAVAAPISKLLGHGYVDGIITIRVVSGRCVLRRVKSRHAAC